MSGNKIKKGFRLGKGFITDISYLDCGDKIKAVICVKRPTFNALLYADGRAYTDAINDEEPFDRKSHVFYIEKAP